MKDTIFTPSFGNRPSALVGRETMIMQLEELLESRPGTKDRAIIMMGQRGTGKTALLWEIADIARSKNYVVASPTVVTEGMLKRIAEKIEDDTANYFTSGNINVTGASVGAFGFSAGIEIDRDKPEKKSYQYTIMNMAKSLTKMNKGLLILVDELKGNSQELRNLVILYQEMVGEGLNVAIYMAGLPMAVSSVLNDHVLTFLNRSKKLSVEPLKNYDIEAYFEVSFEKLGVKINEKMIKEAAESTGGSPYMMQLIGHLITINSKDSGIVSDQILKKSILQAKSEFENDVCMTTIANLSDKDKAFLISMANADEPCSISDIAKGMNVTADYAGKYRKRLLATGIIESPARGKLKIAVPYLKDYLRVSQQ